MEKMQKERVLFVDDDPNLLASLKRMLRQKRNDWDLAFVASGNEALHAFQQQPFDLIISDVKMPALNGVQLLGEIRELYPQTVRILFSGQWDTKPLVDSVGVVHQFLAKPCEPGLLVATIERAFSLRHILVAPAIVELVSRLKSIPSLSTIYHELLAELQSENVRLTKVGEIIARDIGMTAKILQLVNSAFFGLRVRVTSPVQAAKLLGVDLITALALSVGVFSIFDQKKIKAFSLAELTQHSLLVGFCGRQIAGIHTDDRKILEDAILAGVLHDVGKLILADNFPNEYAHILTKKPEKTDSICPDEEKVFGCTHAQVGAYLLTLWGLKKSVVEAVAFHHKPSLCDNSAFSALTGIYIADILYHKLNSAGSYQPEFDEMYLSQLNISDQKKTWQKIYQKTKKKFLM